MKIFENKSIFKKLILVLIIITLFSFCMPKNVTAKGDKNDGVGGKLLNPIMSFFVALGDGTMTLVQKMVLQVDESLIPIDSSSGFWAKLIIVVIAIAACAVIIAATVASAGTASVVFLAATATIRCSFVLAVTTITFPITTQIVEGMLPGNFQLPLFVVTPQEIFSNKIPVLDVDFFNPMEDEVKEEPAKQENKEVNLSYTEQNENGKKYAIFNFANHDFKIDISFKNAGDEDLAYQIQDGIAKYRNPIIGEEVLKYFQDNGEKIEDSSESSINAIRYNINVDGVSYKIKKYYDDQNNPQYKYYRTSNSDIETKVIKSTARELQSTVANWYVILRDIALVSLLSVLVYIGIRILISSTSQDKAKYKQMLVDWIVAICLLFVMQYIMSFSNILVKKIIEIIDTTQVSTDEDSEIIEPEIFLITDKEKVSKAYEVLIDDESTSENNPYYNLFLDANNQVAGSASNAAQLAWPAENFMQQARIKLQLLEDDKDTYVAIGWKLIYVVLVIYTVIFIFTYVKRVIYMAFLTIIAPLVALTYPIDKLNDGKAQAFNMWFKEYIFNLLIQPMHLLLYTILIGSAMDFASKNIIYVVVALFFMVPAEKLLRSFFGFEKAHTPGLLAGPAGAALMMTGMNKLLGRKHSNDKSSSKSSGGSASDDSEDKSNLRFNKLDEVRAMIDGNGNDDGKAKGPKMAQGKVEQEQFPEPGQGKDDIQQAKNPVNQDNGTKNSGGDGNAVPKQPINIRQDINRNKKSNKALRLAKSKLTTGRYYGHKKLENLGKRIQNSHPLRTGLKLYGGLAAGTAGAILGGISGDPTKAAQYGITGAMGGYKAANAVLPDFSNDEDWKAAKEIGNQEYYGDEYDEYKMQQYIKNFQKDYDNQIKLARKFGSEKEAKEFINNDAEYYIRHGITDIDAMAAIHELEKNGVVSSKDMGIAVVNNAEVLGSKPEEMKPKDQEEWHKYIANKFKNHQRFKDSNLNADDAATDLMDKINLYYDAKKK